ncbi:MAG TPA: FAD-dependent oxidoreductase [Acidobacteriota bacterium]|nr:FAD-dependent oxidoreductase [Acidobacteriota bacterium]
MKEKAGYEKILEPGRIGSVKTRNRMIKSGAGMLMWHEDDVHMREEVKAFYEGIARGGVGLLIVESPTIDYPSGVRWKERYRIDDDKYIRGLSELVEVIHKHGCPTFMQMNHDGPWQVKLPFAPEPFYQGSPIGASPVSVDAESDFHNETPRALTVGEIQEIVDKFASAAVRAQKAGFDGVDINAASSHLLHNFFSPFWNRREDDYGGSVENRARFAVDVIREIKKRLGGDFPVSIILNGIEIGQVLGIDDRRCLTPEDSREIAKLLEAAGADAIQVRSHWLGYHVGAYLPDALFYPEPPIPLESFPREYETGRKGIGANITLAAGIKKSVTIPVTVVGRLDADLGEQILREGKVDFIAMTRRLLADPDYPKKIATGKVEDIAPCTACDNCLGSRRCRINGLLGTHFNTIERAEKKKKVLVIGGGPAGMSAARVSALRGHDVTLYEKASSLGGLLPLASMVKGSHPEDLSLLTGYFSRQLDKLGVKVILGREADPATIDAVKPDVVFLAAGGVSTVPEIDGIEKSIVVSGASLHRKLKFFLKYFKPETLRNLSRLYMPIGKRVIVIGGGIQGCELAEFLAKRGKDVTIVEKNEMIGEGMVDALLAHLMIWFRKKRVTVISGVKEYVEITDRGLTIIEKNGGRRTLEADTIVSALPLKPLNVLLEAVSGKADEVYAIGDCRDPLLIADAIGTGVRTARNV